MDLGTWVLVLLALDVGVFAALPLVVQRRTWVRADPRIETCQRSELPAEALRYFHDLARMLGRFGHDLVSYLAVPESSRDTDVWLAFYQDRDGTEGVIGRCAVMTVGQRRKVERSVSVASRLREGAGRVLTDNLPVPPLPPAPDVSYLRAPRLEPAQLLTVHRRRVQESGHPVRAHPMAGPEIMEFLLGELGGLLAQGVALGYLEPARDGRHRLTVRGAYRLTWPSLPGLRRLAAWPGNRQAGRLLAAASPS